MTRFSFLDSINVGIDAPVQLTDSLRTLRTMRDRLSEAVDRLARPFSATSSPSALTAGEAPLAAPAPPPAPAPAPEAPEAIARVTDAAHRTWETLQATTAQATQAVMATATSWGDRAAQTLAEQTSQTRQSFAAVATQTQTRLSDVTHQTQELLADAAQQTTEQVVEASTALSTTLTEQASARFTAIAQRVQPAVTTALNQVEQLSDRLTTVMQTSLAAIPQQWVDAHPVLTWMVGHPLGTLGLSLLSLFLGLGFIRAIARGISTAWFATVDAPYVMGNRMVQRLNQSTQTPNSSMSQPELMHLLTRLEAIGREQNQILRQIAILVGKTQK